MGLQLTVDVFSGRPNPTVDVGDREAGRLLDRLTPTRRFEDDEPAPPDFPLLGYRGIEITQTGATRVEALPRRFRLAGPGVFGRGLAHATRDPGVEDFICGPDGPLAPRIDSALLDVLSPFRSEFMMKWEMQPNLSGWNVLYPCPCAPFYEPWLWTTFGLANNNCYNYATNHRTDTFAQPGRAAGATFHNYICSDLKQAVIVDGVLDATRVVREDCPFNGHVVALVIWPNQDYHWYRRDLTGWWSHKPGSGQASDRDNSNQPIWNPETADRGAYADFCGYMVVQPGRIKIT